jgi:hypothetical protein
MKNLFVALSSPALDTFHLYFPGGASLRCPEPRENGCERFEVFPAGAFLMTDKV